MGRNKGLVSTGKEEHVEKRRSKRKRNTTSNPYNLTPTTSAPEEKRQKKAPPKSSNAISSDSNVPSTKGNKSLVKSLQNTATASESTKQKKARAERTKKASTASRKRSLVHRQPVKQDPECGDLKTEGTEVKGERKENIKDLLKAEVPEMQGLITSAKYVGAHVSVAGGLHNAVTEAVSIGAKAFGLFMKSQRQWQAKPLEDAAAEKFKAACKEYGFSPAVILPHGSYLVNCGSPNIETRQKSREGLLDELQRCEKLGLTLFNFHPGSTCGKVSIEQCLDWIAESINHAHSKTKYAITVLENMSCQGNTIGGRFEELKGIIDRVTDKSRVGVCIDTCHAFAAGFDIKTEKGYEAMMSDFDHIVGLKYLKAIHLNDSKGEVGCHLDRHEIIGKGHIGKEAFQRVMNDPRLNGLPMILETPGYDSYDREIRLLNSLVAEK